MHRWRYHHVEQTEKDITDAAGVVATVDFAHPVRIFEFGFIVGTEAVVIGTATEGVESLDLMSHDRSTVVEKCTITVGTAWAVGHRVSVKLEGVGTEAAFDVQPGEAAVIRHKTQPVTGSIAGKVKFYLKYAILSDANRDATYDHLVTS